MKFNEAAYRTVKFTPENLEKHLIRNYDEIYTGRTRPHGAPGECVLIQDDLWELCTYPVRIRSANMQNNILRMKDLAVGRSYTTNRSGYTANNPEYTCT